MTDVKEGEILAGKYRVERVLGQGGMGVVVAAIHQQLDQRVALKFLLPEGVQNETHVARFVREARAAVRLRSEHVARVLDVGTSESGSPYIVMEYLEGGDLAALLIDHGALPVHTAVSYILQACEAVAEAHANGIIHRDLKPANLFLTKRPDGTPCIKVLDFGISKHSSTGDAALTSTQAIMGTPMYMSPEQMLSSKSVDARSDIWALGMVLYELLIGRVAFDRETLPELCAAILSHSPPSLVAARADIPPELERVVLRALEKEPADRFGSLAEMASALAKFSRAGDEAERRIHRILGGGVPHVSDAPPPVDPPARLELQGPPLRAHHAVPVVAPVCEPQLEAASFGLRPSRRRSVVALLVAATVVLVTLGSAWLAGEGRTRAGAASTAMAAVNPIPVNVPPPEPAMPAPPQPADLPAFGSAPSPAVVVSAPGHVERPKPVARPRLIPTLANPDDLGPRK